MDDDFRRAAIASSMVLAEGLDRLEQQVRLQNLMIVKLASRLGLADYLADILAGGEPSGEGSGPA